MDNTRLPPSQRLQARLNQLQAETPPVDPAIQFIEIAEGFFEDPAATLRAEWRKQVEAVFIFSRAAHDFSDYEAFVYKLMLICAGLGLVDRETATDIVAAVTYAGGKAKIERQGGGTLGITFPDFHKLQTTGVANRIPKAVSAHASDIGELVQRARHHPSPAFRAWLTKNTGKAPGATQGIEGSSVFSNTAGAFGLPLGRMANGKPVFYTGEASLLTIAPPGKGKTQCHVLPTLASYRGPVVALDIKGECYELTSDWRRTNIGPVFRFDPTNPAASARYNPVAFVDSDPDELWQSSRFLADLLIVIKNQNDSTWETQGKDLLTLIIAFVVVSNEPEKRSMAAVLDLVNTVGLTDMLDSVATDVDGDFFPASMRRTASRFAQMAKTAPKQFEGVLGGASLHMQVWEGPKVERVTARSDWAPEDFRSTPCPSLYICIPPNAIETYAPLVRVIVGQHVRRLMRQHDRNHKPILFLLDELPRLGQMQPVREALEVGRSYGIKLWMIAQYPEQIVNAYPGVGEGMMESCDVRMYMNPSAATAERLAKAFGSSKNVFDGTKKPVLEATEIQGTSHRDSIFVLGSNEEPMVLRKAFFSQNRI